MVGRKVLDVNKKRQVILDKLSCSEVYIIIKITKKNSQKPRPSFYFSNDGEYRTCFHPIVSSAAYVCL